MIIFYIFFTVIFGFSDVLASDPEVKLNISGIIHFLGYPCENHDVITRDGYILSLQRIPYGRNNTNITNRSPVLLQHGLLDSAHAWVINLPWQSLALVLSETGYDVWLANSRGNTYSNKHVNLTVNDRKFWDFTFDEMAEFDLVSNVDYILSRTGYGKLGYVAHSQGTLIGFSQLPQNPILRSKISHFVGLGPVTHTTHVEVGLRFLAKFRRELEIILRLEGHGRFMTNTPLMKWLGSTLCGVEGVPRVCSDVIFMIAGYDLKNMNETRLPIYIAHTPAGTSIKNVVHFAQMVDSGLWCKYNYGIVGNLAKYGQMSPPLYSLSNFSTPTLLISGGHDTLADPTDVNELVTKLGSNVYDHIVVPEYNHLDFTWSISAYYRIYPQIVKFLRLRF